MAKKYQRIKISTGELVGTPADLPQSIADLDDSTLANLVIVFPAATLTQLGLEDTGFLPVEVPDPPVRVLKLSKYEFMCRFTPQERAAIRELAKTDEIVADFLDLMDKASAVELDAQNTIGGMGYLVQHSAITAERSVEILA